MKMNETTKEIQASDEETRREFLVTAGKLAIYIPPAIMLLMHPSKDALAKSGGVGTGRGWKKQWGKLSEEKKAAVKMRLVKKALSKSGGGARIRRRIRYRRERS